MRPTIGGVRKCAEVTKQDRGSGSERRGRVSDSYPEKFFFAAKRRLKPLDTATGGRSQIVPAGMTLELPHGPDFCLGGIAAAALGVAQGFLRVSGISTRRIESPQGISLWRPDLPWTSSNADGPALDILPKSLWMLGLGHLGQGYLWALSILPFANPADLHFLLQDFDKTVVGNFSSGLLCESNNVEQRKTRLCAEWLEHRDLLLRSSSGGSTVTPFEPVTSRI